MKNYVELEKVLAILRPCYPEAAEVLTKQLSPIEIPTGRAYGHHFMQAGGEWLANVRSWVQRKKRNGNQVTWGSGEELQPPMTMRELEEAAAEAAAGAYAERCELIKQHKKLQVEYLRLAVGDKEVAPNKT